MQVSTKDIRYEEEAMALNSSYSEGKTKMFIDHWLICDIVQR